MSNNEDYLSKLNVINAIPAHAIQLPGLPVGIYSQECENLYHWALEDADELASVGISRAILDDLPVRAGACREAQSIWMSEYQSKQKAQAAWAVQLLAAFDFRNDLLRSMRYAFRNDTSLLARVATIAKGLSNADMIQDLNDISVLGNDNFELLAAIGITPEKLAIRSDDLASLLAIANGEKGRLSESKILRDKAFTHLKELADRVYDAGKYLFRNDKERIKGYYISYWRKYNSLRKAKKNPITPSLGNVGESDNKDAQLTK